MPNNIRITDHAYQRMKEETGLNKGCQTNDGVSYTKVVFVKTIQQDSFQKYLEARDESYERREIGF